MNELLIFIISCIIGIIIGIIISNRYNISKKLKDPQTKNQSLGEIYSDVSKQLMHKERKNLDINCEICNKKIGLDRYVKREDKYYHKPCIKEKDKQDLANTDIKINEGDIQ